MKKMILAAFTALSLTAAIAPLAMLPRSIQAPMTTPPTASAAATRAPTAATDPYSRDCTRPGKTQPCRRSSQRKGAG